MKTFVLLIIATCIVTGTFAQIFNKEIAHYRYIPGSAAVALENSTQLSSSFENNFPIGATGIVENKLKRHFRLPARAGHLSASDQRKYFLLGAKNKAISNSAFTGTKFWLIVRGISYIIHSLNGKGGLRLCCQKTALTFSPRTLKKVTGLTFSIPIGQ